MNIKTRGALTAAFCASMFATTPAGADAPSAGTAAAPTTEQRDAVTSAPLFDRMLHSSNLRLRVMAGRMPASSDGIFSGSTSTSIDELAGLARGSTDPMVLALLIDPCSNDRLKPRPTCDAVDLAKRWTVADTQNQLAWLTLSAALRARRDLAGSRVAFTRASTASMWHEYFDEGARVIVAAMPRDLDGRARLSTLQLAQSISAMELVPFEAVSAFYFHCKEPGLRDACVRILDTIDRDSGSLLSLQIAIDAAKRAGVDPPTVESRRRAFEALLGASLDDVPRDESEITDATELADAIGRTERRIEVGELASLRAKLKDSGMTESASATRWRQYLAALVEQLNATREASGAP